MSPLGMIMCIGSGLVLLGVSSLLLVQTHAFEVSRRSAWGVVTGAAAAFALTAPVNPHDLDPLLALVLAALAVAGLLWGRSEHAPQCVRETVGWECVSRYMPSSWLPTDIDTGPHHD